MNPRLAWVLPLLTAGVVAVMVPLSRGTEDQQGVALVFGLVFVAYATVGALIASRQPRHPIGWLFAGLGLTGAINETLLAYAASEVSGVDVTVAHTIAAWISAWAKKSFWVALVLILLLFPDGRFLSRRWRTVGVTAVVLAVVWAAATALAPGPLLDLETVTNPVGVESAGAALQFVNAVAFGASLGLLLLGAVSVFARFRVAAVEQRQQIKWIAVAAGFAIMAVATVATLEPVLDTDQGAGDVVTALLVAAALISFPAGAALAILRHRLYDIDVVIKRTLVYGSLTVMLVATYLGVVLVLRLALSPVTGESDLAVAGSTLAVAALVRPLRSRTQAVVDRRFNRARYDAAHTLESFSGRLRDQIDLVALGDDLRRVVHSTVQPAHVTLWLREERR